MFLWLQLLDSDSTALYKTLLIFIGKWKKVGNALPTHKTISISNEDYWKVTCYYTIFGERDWEREQVSESSCDHQDTYNTKEEHCTYYAPGVSFYHSIPTEDSEKMIQKVKGFKVKCQMSPYLSLIILDSD